MQIYPRIGLKVKVKDESWGIPLGERGVIVEILEDEILVYFKDWLGGHGGHSVNGHGHWWMFISHMNKILTLDTPNPYANS